MHKVLKTRLGVMVALFCVIACLSTTGAAQCGSNTFTSVFPDEASFVTEGTNPFWILTPGFQAVLEGQKSGNACASPNADRCWMLLFVE